MTVKNNDKNIDSPLYYINGLNVRKARSADVSLWWCGLEVYLVAEVKAFVSKNRRSCKVGLHFQRPLVVENENTESQQITSLTEASFSSSLKMYC